jgi:hypothetical protein
MQGHPRTTDAREAARRRVRRITGVIVAASVAVAGSIAAYVAGAGTQKAIGGASVSSSRTTTTRQVPAPPAPTPPSLDSNGSSAQPPTQSAPVQPPTQSIAPPVAVSGGS